MSTGEFVIGFVNEPAAKGIVTAVDGADFLVWVRFTLVGLRPGASHRVVFSAQPCAVGVVQGVRRQFAAESKGQRSVSFKLENVQVSSFRSVRVRVLQNGEYQTPAHRCAGTT